MITYSNFMDFGTNGLRTPRSPELNFLGVLQCKRGDHLPSSQSPIALDDDE